MRLLVEVSSKIEEWHQAFITSTDCPRLPLPFSLSAAFFARGHEVSAIHFSDKSFAALDSGRFWKFYGPRDLRRALADNEVALLWARSGIKAVIADLGRLPRQRRVMLASYVWRVPQGAAWKTKGLALTTRLAARFARAVVLMTDEQASEADRSLGGRVPVLRFTWGIDSAFYRGTVTDSDISSIVRQELNDLMREPYVILAGDQQRLDDDALELVERFGLRLVRVPQEPHTADWYRRQIRDRRLGGRLFVFERVGYPTLRYLFRRAQAYVGLVDSTWQPAGWTVLCEALASGTPAIVYEGMTAREIRRLGAGGCVTVVPHRDVEAVARSCHQTTRVRENVIEARAREFSGRVLDLQRTATSFVECVEAISST